jgi:4-amino-4-deoxy-L-arabinose transferase-like glycosyltransferase
LKAFGNLTRVVVGIVIVAALAGPWLYLVQKREAAFLGTSVSHDVLKRIAQPLEGHRGPPGYHLALIFATFFPWSLLLPMAVVFAWRNRAEPQIRFALAAVLGPWVMFELVRTKLPHYMLPAFPPLAFLTADAVVRCLRGEHDDLRRRPFVVAACVVAVVMVGLGAGPVVLAWHFGDPVMPAAALAVSALVVALAVLNALMRGDARKALLRTGAGMGVIYVVLFGVYLPSADALRVSIRTAEILRREGATAPGAAVMMDYKEPSLAFYQGGTIRENSAMVLSHALVDGPARWWVITDEVWERTPGDVRERLEFVGLVSGIAYADGRGVNVVVVRER